MAAMMKEELSTFDILALVVELQSVKGGYIDKIFHWDNNNFLFRFNVPGTGKKEIVLSEVRWIYLAGERPELPDTPTQLAMMMRRHLSGGRVTSIFQRDFDRIIVIEIQKEKKYRLIFELFRDGNLIIADEEKILIALYSRRWKHREIRPGIDYKFPPERFNPLEADFDKFVKLMVASKSD
ncbi:MAG: NFACT family protein, partial [Methanomassiliicoccales archaeon]